MIRIVKMTKNKFCNLRDLTNEATVESLFIDRLLKDLNYPDNRVSRKKSIAEVVIGKGVKKERYKPDYVLLDSVGNPIMVIDAKSPKGNPEDYHYQVSAYALYLNQKYADKNPVRYTIVTNGNHLFVWPWDSNQPVFYLQFEDFQYDNEKYLELRSNLAYDAFKQIASTKDVFKFERPELTSLIRKFNYCHDLIRKKDSLSPTDAFYEFSKLMFIKIREDNRVHNLLKAGTIPKKTDFVLSIHWIDNQVSVEPNPVDSILFRQIQEDLEREIKKGKKKRIFGRGERLSLKAETIYEVVKELQNYDLYGIDEDLNGRMFETFLNATVRGKDLGQFFTPRGIVHYMVETATINITCDKTKQIHENIPYVLDGCCGSGGFLIDVMSEMTKQLSNMTQLSNKERKNYEEELKDKHLFGIDSNEKIARISRLNMHLHGDGGSKIFKANSLDKDLLIDAGMDEEEQTGLEEIRDYLINKKRKFDAILTNPPFSISYKSSDKNEEKILKKYQIAKNDSGSPSSSEKSNVLFLERYEDLLKPEIGELLTIIDDTVLNGEKSQKYRDYISKNFIIIQVVSLPFNTFFRAEANIKTSMIHLRKKVLDEKQGSIFMAITNNIGHDDHSRETPARNNLRIVANFFKEWQEHGSLEPQIIHNEHPDEPLGCPLQVFEVKPEQVNNKRLDAFYYAPELKKIQKELAKMEREDNKIELKRGLDFNIIETLKKEDIKELEGKILKYFEIGDVTTDGTIVKYREDYFEKLPTRARLKVKKNDVIFAKNNSSRGTTVLIPDWFDGNLVTTGFIGIRPKDYEDALMFWNILESELFRKQIYYLSITASQPEIRDNIFREDMLIPWPKLKTDKQKIIENAKKVDMLRNNLIKFLNQAKKDTDDIFS